MKAIMKSLLARTPYRVIRRTDMNRFQAIEDCMRGLEARAYRPRVIIDGGAHLGEFTLLLKKTFPDTESFHLFEPKRLASSRCANCAHAKILSCTNAR